MKKSTHYLLILAFSALVLSSCEKDKDEVPTPNNPNEAELITTMKLIFTEQGTSNELTFAFKDTDGLGGTNPTIDTIRLESSKAYAVEILLLDESKNPVDTISHEVEEEGDEHQIFFTATGANVAFAYADADVNNVPVGLLSTWTTATATTDKNGKIKVALKHQGEDKPNTGNGNAALGDTDIEVSFPILIE